MDPLQEMLLQSSIAEKEGQLLRLQKCAAELQNIQADLRSAKHLCVEPNLSADMWAGNLARKFDQIRENGMQAEAESIDTEQVAKAIGKINEKMAILNQEISNLMKSFSMLAMKSNLPNI